MGRIPRKGGTQDAWELSEADRKAREATKKGAPRVFPAIQLPSARAILLERDNPDEFLEFHWNPDSYTIAKSAKWSTESVEGGTGTQSYNGCSPTTISFEAFLNDLGQPADRQISRSTEESLAWLHNRLRPRTEDDVKRRISDRRRGRDWLNVRDPAAPREPPVMVLFGLRTPFECVLKSANVSTVFQRSRLLPKDARTVADLNRNQRNAGRNFRFNIKSPQRLAEIQRQTGGDITRAKVQIELVEYVNDPSAGQ